MKKRRAGTIVMVAEDDPDDRLLIQDAFKETDPNLHLQFLEDGSALMEYLNQAAAAEPGHPQPDLILLDINMPRKNGWQVMQELKDNPALRHIPVVILTTSNSHEEIQRSYALGGNGFITKPASYSALVQQVKALRKYWFETVSLP